MHDGFDVVRLREHIKSPDGVKGKARVEEKAEVAGEGGRVAGDIADALRLEGEDACDLFGCRARAGRVEEEKVYGRESVCVLGEPVADACRVDGGVRELGVGEVAAGEAGGRRVAFDGDDAREAARERQGEEADAAVEIDRPFARRILECFGKEWFEQRVVDLKEAVGVEAIMLARDVAEAFVRVGGAERRQQRDAVVARHGLKLFDLVPAALADRRAQLREFVLYFGQDDGTFDHVADAVRSELVVADELAHRVVLPAGARTIAPDGGRGRDGNFGGWFDPRDAPQAVADDLDLGLQLRLVVQLLEVAPAAPAEIGTGRFDARGRRPDDLRDGREDHLAPHAFDARAHEIAGGGQRDEKRAPVGVRQPRAAGHDALDLDLVDRAFRRLILIPARRFSSPLLLPLVHSSTKRRPSGGSYPVVRRPGFGLRGRLEPNVRAFEFEFEAADGVCRDVVDERRERADAEPERGVEDGDEDHHREAADEAARRGGTRPLRAGRHHHRTEDDKEEAVDQADDQPDGRHHHTLHFRQ